MSRAELRLAIRFALREMRGGLSGFRIFLACIVLGVASIAAVNSVSQMMQAGIATEGRAILGGDLRFNLGQREASGEELAWMGEMGAVATSLSMRSMARLPDGSDQTLAEIKAVDEAYPLAGTVELDRPEPLHALLAERDGLYGAVAPREFYGRLGLEPGAIVRLGDIDLELRGTLEREPDVLSDGFLFAPRLMLSIEAMRLSGLVQPGSLLSHIYKLDLAADADPATAVADEANETFPDAGWSIRTAERAAPALQDNITRFSQFLTLVGLTALIVGGVGVANAVNAYLDSKRAVIATFKSLGASGGFVVTLYLVQILALTGVGILIGLVLGALAPFTTAGFLESVIPVGASASIYPSPLALAALFGLLTALAFALLPLGRTRDVPATALFRQGGGAGRQRMRLAYAAAVAVLAALVAGLALLVADDRRLAATFLVATLVAFAVLRALAALIQALARRAPRVSSTPLRLAIGNIHRPGALTASVTLSLGLGLTLLVTLAAIDTDLRREIGTTIAARAPNFFFVDIQNTEIDGFRDRIEELAPGSTLQSVPMLRGRITALNGTDVREVPVPPEGAWVLRGDRGLTYSAAVPENSTLTQGEWWAQDYDGEPLVSFAAQEGEELGFAIGDTVTVNVLGRTVTARIANFRSVEWESMSINFVMVFTPNTFAGAPHAWLATLDLAAEAGQADDFAAERTILSSLAQDFPAVTSVRVRDALDAVNDLIAQLALAIRAAAAVALVASVLVLSGALAAGNRGRVHDAVVLKTLGATRATLIRAYATEYALLGAATALFAIGSGALAAWFVVSRIMQLPSHFDLTIALTTLAVSLVLTIGFGLTGTWRVLGQKAAPVLREL